VGRLAPLNKRPSRLSSPATPFLNAQAAKMGEITLEGGASEGLDALRQKVMNSLAYGQATTLRKVIDEQTAGGDYSTTSSTYSSRSRSRRRCSSLGELGNHAEEGRRPEGKEKQETTN